jgi:general stress protein 26
MADAREHQDPKVPPAGESVPAADQPTEAGPARREFLRQMSGDAVRTAGRLAGFSSIIRRSVVAAGGAAIRDLEAPADDRQVQPGETAAETAVGAPPNQGSPEPSAATPPQRDPVASLTPEQDDFLATGAQAIMAVNDPSGAPHLTSSMYHWDGQLLRLPGRLSSARAIDIDRDPRVSVLVEDRDTEAWVAITGTASLSSLDTVEIEMLQILTRYFQPEIAARRWDEMRQNGDQIVIHIRPVRFVWRPA